MPYEFSHIMEGARPSEIRELLKYASMPGMISFGGGMPNPKSFAIDAIREIVDDILIKNGKYALQYGNTAGLPELREEISKMVRETEGIEATFKDIIVTTGSQQALYALPKVLVNPGETVITEAPTYIGAISAFNANGVRMAGIPMDKDGMKTDVLQATLEKMKSEGKKPKYIYVIPNFQNPAGYTMSLERRKHLVDLSNDSGIPIVEDNPYGELRFSGRKLPSIKSLNPGGEVTYLGTFSKVMTPGLRIGFTISSEAVVGKINLLKQAVDLSTNTLSEFIAMEYLKRGIMKVQIPKTIELYRKKRDLMLSSLEKYFPEGSDWSRPDGGMFIWTEVDSGIDTTAMIRKALEKKVAYVSGASFFPDGSRKNNMRLNFTFSEDDQIVEGIRRLGEVVSSELKIAKEA